MYGSFKVFMCNCMACKLSLHLCMTICLTSTQGGGEWKDHNLDALDDSWEDCCGSWSQEASDFPFQSVLFKFLDVRAPLAGVLREGEGEGGEGEGGGGKGGEVMEGEGGEVGMR